VFTGRYQSTHVPSRDCCIATAVHATLLGDTFQITHPDQRTTPNTQITEPVEGSGRDLNLGTIPEFSWGTEETNETPLTITGVPAKIRNVHLQNTSL
jgi:hypothetical protein